MAETFVSGIASSLLKTLVSKSYEEISRAYGVYEDLQKLKETLSIVRGLLLDAEKKKDKPQRLSEWLRQIQNICFDAEDVLDEFEVQDKRKQVVEGLSQENCFSLFVKWAFKQGKEVNYPNLEEIGKEIVKKCKGVPLAVKTLGSSLFSEYDLDKWILVRDSEMWNLKQKEGDILPALKLSYDQMTFHLRRCFACFSLYPKDYSFNSFDIGILWVALGFVQSQTESEKLEDVTREYVEELKSKSFLQDFEDVGYYSEFKVHDLVHDLALYVAKNDFVVVNSLSQNILEQARHLSFVENVSLDGVFFPESKSVRTILFPMDAAVGLVSETLLDIWISKYKYLRYLDLSDSSFETIPDSIAKLKHLRALDLSDNNIIGNLPHSICKLQNLQVLSLSGCTNLKSLPKGLGKLISMRHLIITTQQSTLSENDFASFIHLQTLGFHFCYNLKFLFDKAQLASVETLLHHVLN